MGTATQVDAVCPYCGAVHPTEARICPATGRRLRPLARGLPHRLGGSGLWLTLGGLGALLILSGLVLTLLEQRPAPAVAVINQTQPTALSTDGIPLAFTQAVNSSSTATRVRPTATSLPTETPSTPTEPAVTPTLAPPLAGSACAGTLPARLRVGDTAYVSFDPPDPNRVRENPGTGQRVLGRIFPGESFVVLDGPACANGWVWWKVRAHKDGLTGWTAEGSAGTYWLVPLATATPVAATLGITSAPRFFDFIACAQPCAADGSNATRTFPQRTTKLYARWYYENVPIGAHYVRMWTMNNREWVRYDCTWPGPETGVAEISLSEPGGLHSGVWEVTILVNGNAMLREQLVVEGEWTLWTPAGIFNTCYGKN